jgi:N-acetylgalactosamine-N,N'-diacetylbacillosaminyl-diphospho-undecaprenol 4-alpha-N-acetylgalactosaminyltransferase
MKFGGAERVVNALLWNLKEVFDIHLALYSNEVEFELPADIKILQLNQPLHQGFARAFFLMPFMARKLKRYCTENDIKISVGFLNRPCYTNALMRVLYGYKGRIVLSERTHQSTMLKGNSAFYRNVSSIMVKFAYKHADWVVANSYAIREDLQNRFNIRTPISVIHNPVDLSTIRKMMMEPVAFKKENGLFYFVAVGGFRKEKNYKVLLEALALIQNQPVCLLLVGEGELQKQLEQQVEELDLRDKVIFTGATSNPYKYMHLADAMVLSSYVEGFPNVLLEGLACGKAVVSTDCKSGPREILEPSSNFNEQVHSGYICAQYGILTAVNDARSLADGMMRLLEDEPLRTAYAATAGKRAENFNVQETCKLYAQAFRG